MDTNGSKPIWQDAGKARQRRSRLAQRPTVRPRVGFASSLAAASPYGLFAHPAWLFSVVSRLDICDGYRGHDEFARNLLDPSDSGLHFREQRGGDMQSALADSNINVGFRETMEVASSGDQQAELLGKAQILASLTGCMGAVVDLHTIESSRFEISNQFD